MPDSSVGLSVCPAVASTGQQCQLPAHHNSAHEFEDEHGKMTWEPRYVGDLRRELEAGTWRWQGLLADVLDDLPEALRSEAIDEARRALKEVEQHA